MAESDDDFKLAVKALRHDARNLLAGVQVFADRMGEGDDPKMRQVMDHVVGRLKALIRTAERADILAGIESGETAELTAGELVEMARGRLDTDTSAVEVSGTDAVLRCDPELSALALSEVLHNAILSGGEVTLRATEDAVTVSDTGKGLPVFALDDLLTPFRGAKRPGGSSLGLPIADRAMQAQKGSLSYGQGEGDKGTTVTLRWSGT